ncbi:hypothetical protein [Streptomyces sp. NPDC017868]|uniref:hypothetical protein n=1 Tax=Streptomyces sp. NPDC017868 TaxID=3365014 RepID=UPI0037AA00CE
MTFSMFGDDGAGADFYRLALPALAANDLSGPSVEFSLTYVFGGPDLGFGRGWQPSFPSYEFATRTLRYGRERSVLDVPGETASLRLSRADEALRLVHRSGLVDVLSPAEGSPIALVSKTHAPSGHSVSYAYSGERQLTSVDDQSRQLLRIERSSDNIRIIYPGDGGDLATYVLTLKGGLVTEAVPPAGDASWSFTYEDGQLATARSPLGHVSEYEKGKLIAVRQPDGTVVSAANSETATA